MIRAGLAGLACLGLLALAPDSGVEFRAGAWRAWLDSPGGELPFGLEIDRSGARLSAWISNGAERIEVPHVVEEGGELVLDITHYDSTIRAKPSASGSRLDGEWKKRRSSDRWARLAFHATAGSAPRFRAESAATPPVERARGVSGRWAVRFSGSDEPAVAILEVKPDGTATGTFLTTTGDYRYLAGLYEAGRLRLSCFDGAHAFLFDARLKADGTLAGDFWSADSSHETWTARLDPDAALPDPFLETAWATGARLDELSFPDLEGRRRSLGDAAFAGKARIVQLFGSWCPNCQDETALLVELDRRHRDRGLSILGLAFEVTGDFARDAAQVKKLAERHGVKYPLHVAGLADKAEASKAFPAIDRVRAFPTTIFLHADGRMRAVHSGFDGPATGSSHRDLRARFESLVEELLTEPDASRR